MACQAFAPSVLMLEVVLGYIGLRPMLLLVPLRGAWFINPNGIYFIWHNLYKLTFVNSLSVGWRIPLGQKMQK